MTYKLPKRVILRKTIMTILYLFFIAIVFGTELFTNTITDPETNVEEIILKDNALLIIGIIFVAVIVVSFVYALLSWVYTTYYFGEESVTLKKGILFKRKRILTYNRINAIDRKRNIVDLLFGLSTLSLDSGSALNSEIPEIYITELTSKIDLLEKRISSIINKTHDSIDSDEIELDSNNAIENLESNDGIIINKIEKPLNEEKVLKEKKDAYTEYNFTPKSKILYTLLNKKTFSIIFLFVILNLLTTIISLLGSNPNVADILLYIVFFSIIGILVLVFFHLMTIINYYNFRIFSTEKDIRIEHGLITIRKNTINKNRIKAVSINQGFIQRIFKKATINLEVIGFGRVGSNETSIAIPICKLSEVSTYLAKIFPEFELLDLNIKPMKKSLRFYIGIPVIVSLFFIPLLYCVTLYFSFLIIPVIFLLGLFFGILGNNTHSMGYNDKIVCVSNGYLSKRIVIIPFKNVTCISNIDTHNRFKKNTSSVRIHFVNNFTRNTETVNFINNEVYLDLLEKIRKEAKW